MGEKIGFKKNLEIVKLYNEAPYSLYGVDFSPILKSLPVDALNNLRGKRALEVGCGAGHISIFLADIFARIAGMDLSAKSLEIANRKKQEFNKSNVDFIHSDLFDDNFIAQNRGKYEYILCYGVLHHTPNPRAGFNQLCKLLKSGDMLTVGVYSRTSWIYRLKRAIVIFLARGDREKIRRVSQDIFFNKKASKLEIFDGFINPFVFFHSIGEVYNWGRENNLIYVGSYPPIEICAYPRLLWEAIASRKTKFSAGRCSGIWEKLSYNFLSFMLVEFLWILSGKSVMINISWKKP